MKCFGSSESRFSLVAPQIYKGDSGAITAFDYFQALRNRHLVHDVNSYAQGQPGAILNNKRASHKIAKIVCSSIFSQTLNQANFGNLHQLITIAQKWLTDQFETLCEILTGELEAMEYEELSSQESLIYKVPDVDELFQTRERLGKK